MANSSDEEKITDRFKRIYTQGTFFGYTVLVDRTTGVNYLFVSNGNSGGLSVLLDKDGKPIVTPQHADKA